MALTNEWKKKIEYYLQALPGYFCTPMGQLTWEGFVTKERLTLAEARTIPREPFPEGHLRGEKWEYAWMFTRVTVPADCAGQRLVIKSDNGESTVWVNGQVIGAFDKEHDALTLTWNAEAGQEFEIILEAYAGHGAVQQAYGAVMDVSENRVQWTHWGGDNNYPRKVKNGLWGVWNEEVFAPWLDLSLLYDLRNDLKADDQRTVMIDKVLRQAAAVIDLNRPFAGVISTLQEAREILRPAMECTNGSSIPTMYAFGHSHLDLEWLWTDAETRRKIARTVGNQLQLIKEYPEYRYLQSQPWLMDVLKKEYPELYAEFKEAVKAGNIVVEGGSWVEPDVNLPSGESLVRQYLYGKKFLKEEFGVDSRIMWLPDSFGCGCALPQIMKGCGLDYFLSAKLPWVYNDGEKFPMTSFRWKGIDGTEVLSHVMTNYESSMIPRGIRRLWYRPDNHAMETGIRIYPFGHGDGGGGATRLHLEYARREKDLEGVPKIKMSTPTEFFEDLSRCDIRDTYTGELYYPAHRGTYTTQAKTKKLNRRAELSLRSAEMADALFGTDDRNDYEENWKTVLFNQFHDIIPGSSIAEVYIQTEAELSEVISWADGRTRAALEGWTAPDDKCLTLFNTLSWPRKVLVALPEGIGAAWDGDGKALLTQRRGETVYALAELPSCGVAVIRVDAGDAPAEKAEETLCLENDLIKVMFNACGEIVSIFDKETGLESLSGRANRFRMYQDMPLFCEAWDIDSHYQEQELTLEEDTKISQVFRGPLMSSLKIEKRLHDSRLVQTVILREGCRQVDFVTKVDWKENQKLLKVFFETNLNADGLDSEMQYGYINRPNRRNNDYDRDRFEVCQHRWSALAENRRIFAVLNDCKYGISAEGGNVGLTLLKASAAPAFDADKGMQEFTYSILLAKEVSQVVRAGWELNTDVPAVRGRCTEGSVFSVSADNVILDAVKKAEDGSGAVVVRLYECANSLTGCTLKTSLPVKAAYITNMLEETVQKIPADQGEISIQLKGFEVVTLKLELESPAN